MSWKRLTRSSEMSDAIVLFDPTVDLELPRSWSMARRLEDGAAYRNSDGLTVILSGAVELDGLEWLHLSVSRKSRLPAWRDLVLVKTLFIGAERTAYQIVPDHRRHVNIHPYCLHLWAPRLAAADPLPDFCRGGSTI